MARSRTLLILLALLASALFAGCTTPASPPHEVTVTTEDLRFQAPATVEAGWNTITLDNQGDDLHHLQLIQLADGKEVEDLFAEMSPAGVPPSWASEYGGPNAAMPGSSSRATVWLDPGTYVLADFIPDRNG
ncbi:MAG: hypothetical protein R3185_03800, partial [Candidatus Thermoplasmatota archaeon]|nr:hypothetical protein [Candidatus Thermoplasmatota archaeon]